MSAFKTGSAWLLGLIHAVNGLLMLAAPLAWYQAVPTVPGTGPFNPHFVRDIGSAYLAAGLGLLWLARDARAWAGAFVGSLFLGLHALTHVWDLLAGREEFAHFAIDSVLVLLPTAWALWLSWPRGRAPGAAA
jgi:hypothetical protein